MPPCAVETRAGRHIIAHGVTLSQFARMLSFPTRATVVDQTGLIRSFAASNSNGDLMQRVQARMLRPVPSPLSIPREQVVSPKGPAVISGPAACRFWSVASFIVRRERNRPQAQATDRTQRVTDCLRPKTGGLPSWFRIQRVDGVGGRSAFLQCAVSNRRTSALMASTRMERRGWECGLSRCSSAPSPGRLCRPSRLPRTRRRSPSRAHPVRHPTNWYWLQKTKRHTSSQPFRITFRPWCAIADKWPRHSITTSLRSYECRSGRSTFTSEGRRDEPGKPKRAGRPTPMQQER